MRCPVYWYTGTSQCTLADGHKGSHQYKWQWLGDSETKEEK